MRQGASHVSGVDPKEVGDVHTQPPCEPSDRPQTGVDPPSLNLRDVAPIEVSAADKVLLRPPPLLTESLHTVAKESLHGEVLERLVMAAGHLRNCAHKLRESP